MENSGRKGPVFLVLTVLLIASFLPALPLIAGENDPPNNQTLNHMTKWWNVTDAKTYTGGTFIIMEGQNVTVKNGGTLTLDHSKLFFTNPTEGKYGLTVESGGTFIMKNKSSLSSNGTIPFFCTFDAGSNILIKDSFVSNISSNWEYNYMKVGIYSESTNLTIDHSVLDNNTYGNTMLTINASGSALIKNSTILMHYPSFGLNLFDGSKVTVYDTTIRRVGPWSYFGIMAYDSEVDVQNCEIDGFAWYSLYLQHSTGYIYKNKIHNSTVGIYMYHSTNEIVDNDIYNNEYGLIVTGKSQVDMHGGNLVYHNNQRGLDITDGVTFSSKGDVFQSNKSNLEVIYSEASNLTFEDATIEIYQFGYGIRAEYSTFLTIKDSSINGKNRSYWPYAILHEYSGELNVYNCNFNNLGEAIYSEYNTDDHVKDSTFTNSYYGMDIEYSSTMESQNNTFSDVTVPFYLYESTATSMDDTASSDLDDPGYAMAVDSYSYFIAHGLSGTMSGANASYAFISQYSGLELYDCTFTAPSAIAHFLLNSHSHLLSINSGTKTTDPMMFLDEHSTVDIGWHADLRTEWQNTAPAANAQVSYTDSKGMVSGSFVTDDNGVASLDFIQYTVDRAGTINHNPYELMAEIGGMNGTAAPTIIGNRLEPNPITITLTDTDAPMINITSPAVDWTTKDGMFQMTGTASDLGAGIDSVEVNNGTGWVDAVGTDNWTYDWDLTEGTYKLEARVTDMAGLVSSTYVNVTVDMTPPALLITEPTTLYMTQNKFLVNGTTDGLNVTIDGVGTAITDGNFSYEVNLSDGAHDITVVATDEVGNTVTVVKHVIVDTVAPTLTSKVTTGSLYSEPALMLYGTTDGDFVTVNGVAATVDIMNKTWTIDLTLTEGSNVLAIQAKDLAGHTTDLQITVVLDTTPPVITVSSPSGAGPLDTNIASLDLVGNVTGTTMLTFNGANVTLDANGNFSKAVALTEGQNKLTLMAKDLAGNIAKWEFTVNLDTKAPKLVITSPAAGLLTKSGTVQVSGTVDDVTAALTSGTTTLVNDNGAFTFTATLAVGANTITVTATDAVGNNMTATITVTYKNAATLTVTSPTKTSVSTSKQQITITGTSEPGSKVYINGVGIPTNADGSFSYDLVLKTGKTTVTVKAVDTAGNEKSAPSFTVDRKAAATGTDMGTVAGIGIVLLIIGLIVGILVGMMMGKPKKENTPIEDDEEEEDTPVEEDKAPEEE